MYPSQRCHPAPSMRSMSGSQGSPRRNRHGGVLGRAAAVTLLLLGLTPAFAPPCAAVDKARRLEATWRELLPDLRAGGFQPGAPILVRIFKLESQLEVWLGKEQRYALFRIYPICMYSGQLGPKLREGDRQSPEGFYQVTIEDLDPASRFHLGFDIGYPNGYDLAHGRTGHGLMVHGDCVSRGCFAMTDPLIEEIYVLASVALANGQHAFQVQVFPFRMHEHRLRRYRETRWYPFWRNLQEGYNYFERHRLPPVVTVERRHYLFGNQGATVRPGAAPSLAQLPSPGSETPPTP